MINTSIWENRAETKALTALYCRTQDRVEQLTQYLLIPQHLKHKERGKVFSKYRYSHFQGHSWKSITHSMPFHVQKVKLGSVVSSLEVSLPPPHLEGRYKNHRASQAALCLMDNTDVLWEPQRVLQQLWLLAYRETLQTGLPSRRHSFIYGQMAGSGPRTPFLAFLQRDSIATLLGKAQECLALTERYFITCAHW